jgi:hypothetical protein
MFILNKLLRKFVRAWPGKYYFGEYRFLPLFFISGATLEYVMIHWHAGETNFYKVYKRNKVQEIIEKRERAALFESGDLKIEIH